MLHAAISSSGPRIRVRYREFVARHEVAWELVFGGLAVVFVALAFVPVVPRSATDEAIYALESLITACTSPSSVPDCAPQSHDGAMC